MILPAFALTILTFAAMIPGFLLILSLAFMLSTLFKNAGLSIAMAMLLYFIVLPIAQSLAMFGATFLRFTIFTHLDLSSYFLLTTPVEGQTPLLTVIMMAIHIIGFLALSYIFFTKRDAK